MIGFKEFSLNLLDQRKDKLTGSFQKAPNCPIQSSCYTMTIILSLRLFIFSPITNWLTTHSHFQYQPTPSCSFTITLLKTFSRTPQACQYPGILGSSGSCEVYCGPINTLSLRIHLVLKAKIMKLPINIEKGSKVASDGWRNFHCIKTSTNIGIIRFVDSQKKL